VLDVVLALHVGAGAVGLVAGPAAWTARRRHRHTRAGWLYQGCVAVLCSSTLMLVAADPALWPFALIAVGTQAAAVAGVVVRRRRRPGWLPQHVQLVLGSYVSFVTAFAVQTFGGLWAWVVPSAVGGTAVAVVTARVAQRTAASASGSVKAPA
jgi:uncharacterized membrane protein YeaQ/YmgE (transglycosylase-associated protein family)